MNEPEWEILAEDEDQYEYCYYHQDIQADHYCDLQDVGRLTYWTLAGQYHWECIHCGLKGQASDMSVIEFLALKRHDRCEP